MATFHTCLTFVHILLPKSSIGVVYLTRVGNEKAKISMRSRVTRGVGIKVDLLPNVAQKKPQQLLLKSDSKNNLKSCYQKIWATFFAKTL